MKEVETNISKNTFLKNVRMSALPTLYKTFVELVGYLVSNKQLYEYVYTFPYIAFSVLSSQTEITMLYFKRDGNSSKRDSVVLLLQDMLEVVTRDMMVNEIRYVYLVWFCLMKNAFLKAPIVYWYAKYISCITNFTFTDTFSEVLELGNSGMVGNQLFASVVFPPKVTPQLEEQVWLICFNPCFYIK